MHSFRRSKRGGGGGGAMSSSSIVLAVIASSLLLLPTQTNAQNCDWVDCKTVCDDAHQQFSPQDCDSCCGHNSGGAGGQNVSKDDINKRMEALEAEVKKLTIMIAVVLAILGLVLVLGLCVLVVRYPSTKTLKEALPVFFRNRNEGRASIEKRPPPSTKAPAENRCSTVLRIAEYQNNHSPLTKRMRANGQVPQDPSMPDHTSGPSSHLPRPRQPSESTCPEDSGDIMPHQHAYDNLALSTSTLHDTTASSTSTLGPAISTHTLDTTLPSVNHSVPTVI